MKDRRKVRAGLAAVAALCTVAAAPGTSLADGADGARAYETRGTRISGAGAGSGARPWRPAAPMSTASGRARSGTTA
ncbi:hypothetical protein SANTM175S_06565 [Streptomyces antimycoticus]